MNIVELEKIKLVRGFGIGMLVVGLICLIGAKIYGDAIKWSTTLAVFGWLIPIVIGVILIITGLIVFIAIMIKIEHNKDV